jgi:hypothetical protein
LAESRLVLKINPQSLGRLRRGNRAKPVGPLAQKRRLLLRIGLAMPRSRTQVGISQPMEQVIHAGQRAKQVKLLGQDPLHVFAAKRTDFVLGRRPGVETLADLLLLLERERQSRLAAATIVEPREAVFVVAPHPTLADAARQADGHRHGGRRPAFAAKNHNSQPLGTIGVLLNSLEPLQLRERQVILHVHRHLPGKSPRYHDG